MKELTFLKELILISQIGQKSVIFVIIVFLDKNFNYEPYLCNGCHGLMQKAINFNDVAIVSITGNDYKIHFWYMSKCDEINLLKNTVLDNKGVS